MQWYNRTMTKREQTIKQQCKWSDIILRSLLAAGLLLLGLSWPRLLAGKSAWVEQVYSEGVYQPIRRAISFITRLVPFSVAELLFYALIAGVALLLLVRLLQLLAKKIAFSRLLGSIVSILLAGGIALNLFYLTWGFNYFREPLAERLGLTVTTRSVDELEAFVRKTATEARALRETLHEDANGVFAPEESKEELFSKLSAAYHSLSTIHAAFPDDPTRAKKILWSTGLSWQGISGIYIGLTAEPNVNADQPPLLLYQAAAH